MNIDVNAHGGGRDFWIGSLFSFVVHALIVVVLVVALSIETDDEREDQQESMEVVLDETIHQAQPEVEAVEPETEETQEPVEQRPEEVAQEVQEEEETIDDDDEMPDDSPLDRYAVDQVTDDEEPEQADHVSDQAHRTEEETVAEITTIEDVEPTDDPESVEQDADTEREIAMQTLEQEFEEPDLVDVEEFDEPEEIEEIEEIEELDESDDLEEPEELAEPLEEFADETPTREYRDPSEMILGPREEDADLDVAESIDRQSVFERDVAKAREVLERKPGETSEQRPRQGRRLLSSWRENEEAMRANLENFIPHIQPGNHTSVNARAAPHASYIARMHRTIHPRWAESFIPRVSRNFSSSDAINDRSLEVVIEIVIDAASGEVVETGRARPSGHDLFDAEAANVARSVSPQPEPPDSMVSPDGKVYIHWTFWRDQRRCGTFGARIYRLEEGGQRRQINGSSGGG